MKGELTTISLEELQGLMLTSDPALLEYAKASSPLLAGLFGSQLVFIIGLIPQPNRGYIWLQILPRCPNCELTSISPLAARRFIISALQRSGALTGHCNTEVGRRWWAGLGATFTHIRDDIFQFEIG